jgi:uncharacterized protein YjbI with pentapeptide repeats
VGKRRITPGSVSPVRIAGFTIGGVGLAVGICGMTYEGAFAQQEINAFYPNIVTEALSIALAVIVIDALYDRRETQRQKSRLIHEMGCPDNGIALRAVKDLRTEGWLFDKTLEGADLLKANLEGADLRGVNLRHARLIDANLRGANLEEACLENAIMYQCDLERARLVHANLHAASLNKANLRRAHLADADLSGSTLHGADLTGATSSPGTRFQRAEFVSALWPGAHLNGAQMERADLSWANLEGASLVGADLRGAAAPGVHLQHANLHGADLASANLEQAKFHAANLTEALLHGADLHEARLQDADLTGADLGGAEMRGAVLHHAVLCGVNLSGALHLTDRQLCTAAALRGAVMIESARYDGRYLLAGDISAACHSGIELTRDEAMAQFYRITCEIYAAGQVWMRTHLADLRHTGLDVTC